MMSYEPALANVDETLRRSIKVATSLGAMVRDGSITKEQNDAMMIELLAWDKGAAEPSWYAELFGSKKSEVTN